MKRGQPSLKIKYFFPTDSPLLQFHPLAPRPPRALPVCFFDVHSIPAENTIFAAIENARLMRVSFYFSARRDPDGRPEMKRTVKGAGGLPRKPERETKTRGCWDKNRAGKLINGGLSSARAIKARIARKKRRSFRFLDRNRASAAARSFVNFLAMCSVLLKRGTLHMELLLIWNTGI